jgi:hypothetical protein
MPKVLIRVSPTPLPPEQRLAYPIQFLARATGVSTRLLYKQIKLGKLRAFKIGDRTIILPEDAQKLLRAEPMGVVRTTEHPADSDAGEAIGEVTEKQIEGAGAGRPTANAAEVARICEGAGGAESVGTSKTTQDKEDAEAGAEVRDGSAK